MQIKHAQFLKLFPAMTIAIFDELKINADAWKKFEKQFEVCCLVNARTAKSKRMLGLEVTNASARALIDATTSLKTTRRLHNTIIASNPLRSTANFTSKLTDTCAVKRRQRHA